MGFFGPAPETFAVDIGNPRSADQLTRYLTDIAGPIYRPGDLTEAAAWRQVAALERIAAGIETIVESITAPQAPPAPTPMSDQTDQYDDPTMRIQR